MCLFNLHTFFPWIRMHMCWCHLVWKSGAVPKVARIHWEFDSCTFADENLHGKIKTNKQTCFSQRHLNGKVCFESPRLACYCCPFISWSNAVALSGFNSVALLNRIIKQDPMLSLYQLIQCCCFTRINHQNLNLNKQVQSPRLVCYCCRFIRI